MVPVKSHAPAAETAETLSTVATTESFRTIGAEMINLPDPTAVGKLSVADPAVSSKVIDPPVPVAMVVLFVVLATSGLKVIDPTVTAASVVTLRLAVWAGLELMKVAAAPTAFGTEAGFQLAALVHVPPAATFHVCARAGMAANATVAVTNRASENRAQDRPRGDTQS